MHMHMHISYMYAHMYVYTYVKAGCRWSYVYMQCRPEAFSSGPHFSARLQQEPYNKDNLFDGDLWLNQTQKAC